jgi:hypothetical protein
MSKQYTHEEVRTAFIAAQERLKPAVLKNSLEDRTFIERLITQYMLANQLEPTADTFYSVFNHHIKVLPWAVKPAKLIAQEQNERPATQQSAEKALKPFLDKKAAGEKADAQKAADEVSIKQAKSLIAGYTPTKTTPRGQVIDYADQSRAQEHWTKALNQAVTGKQNLQSWVTALAEAIQERYAARERTSERL